MIRAVLDTNVLASAFVGFAKADRAPTRLLQLWQQQHFELVVSAEILSELQHTFEDPYFSRRLTSEQIDAARHLLLSQATLAMLTVEVSGMATHSEDDRVLAAAVSSQVDYLVTGDRQLQRLGTYRGVRIVSPRQFLALLHLDDAVE